MQQQQDRPKMLLNTPHLLRPVPLATAAGPAVLRTTRTRLLLALAPVLPLPLLALLRLVLGSSSLEQPSVPLSCSMSSSSASKSLSQSDRGWLCKLLAGRFAPRPRVLRAVRATGSSGMLLVLSTRLAATCAMRLSRASPVITTCAALGLLGDVFTLLCCCVCSVGAGIAG